MQQHNDTNVQDLTIPIVPGGIAYSAPFLLLGSVGFSFTTTATGTVAGTATILVQYTDIGYSDEYLKPNSTSSGPPTGAAAGWYPWTVGPQTYANGRYEDRVMAKWARIVINDTGGASTGNINVALTVRRYIGG